MKECRHENAEWGFYLEYPLAWEVVWKDETAGSWMIPIGVAGPMGSDGRPFCCVNVLREEILQGDDSILVTRVLADGRIIDAPRTPAEYIKIARAQPVLDLPGYVYTSESRELSISGCPAVLMPARYEGAKGTILEETITVFAPGRTFQLICELPRKQRKKYGPLLKKIQESFMLKPR